MAARSEGKTALVLASGGLTGVAYEVGALRGLDRILTNRTVNDFDIYVGTSAGAVVAASLASGMPPMVLAGLVAGTVPGFRRLSRMALYRPNVGEALNRLKGAPELFRRAAGDYWRFRGRVPLSETILTLAPLLPSGIFTNEGIVDYITETFRTAGLSDDFRDIPKELHIMAADIETDERVDFSRATTPHIPVSRAVAASTAIPILFRPVEIEGRHYVDGGVKGQAAIDIAISRGATLIVIVNGLVPLDTAAIARRATVSEARQSIFDLGIRAIANQVIRGMLHDSLIDHLKAVREKHPEVDFLLIEPSPDDEKMSLPRGYELLGPDDRASARLRNRGQRPSQDLAVSLADPAPARDRNHPKGSREQAAGGARRRDGEARQHGRPALSDRPRPANNRRCEGGHQRPGQAACRGRGGDRAEQAGSEGDR